MITSSIKICTCCGKFMDKNRHLDCEKHEHDRDGLSYCSTNTLKFSDNLIKDRERSKREDSQKCEMRCSEHCGNTVRDK